jgi:hypothetical protein
MVTLRVGGELGLDVVFGRERGEGEDEGPGKRHPDKTRARMTNRGT